MTDGGMQMCVCLRRTRKRSEDLAFSAAQCQSLLLVSTDLRNFQEIIKIQ